MICDCGISWSYSFAFYNHLAEEERTCCVLVVKWLLCFVSLSRGAVGWSVCGISCNSYVLLIILLRKRNMVALL